MELKMMTCTALASAALTAAPLMAQDTTSEMGGDADDAVSQEEVLEQAVEENAEIFTEAADDLQDSPSPTDAPAVEAAIEASVASEMEADLDAAKPCELHVWPTENYLGIKMGLLSGFGIVGALADQAASKGKVTTIKDLMREYLGPEVQLAELEKLDYVSQLGLSEDEYRIVLQDPTPWNEDLKDNPELKAEVKALNKKLKRGERITDSTNDCYAELVTTHIFYHKAMMYGSNLFTGWNFRMFDGDTVTRQGKGQVKNPLEEFPPKSEDMIDTAKAELRDAYSKDFVEWVEKKSGA